MNFNSNTRLYGLLGLGAAAGVLAGRFLPPAGVMARSAMRGRMGGDPFDLLIKDHRKIQQCLRDMEECSPDEKVKRGKLFLTLKRRIGKHALAEEDVVYPYLQAELGAEEAARQLFAEHGELKVRLFKLEAMLKEGRDWRDEVRSLREFLEGHIREEEERQFPRIRQALSREESKILASAVSREEALLL